MSKPSSFIQECKEQLQQKYLNSDLLRKYSSSLQQFLSSEQITPQFLKIIIHVLKILGRQKYLIHLAQKMKSLAEDKSKMRRINQSYPKLFSILSHLVSKMDIHIHLQEEVSLPLDILPETLIPDYSCVAISTFLIEKIPVQYEPNPKNKNCPFILKSPDQIGESELRKIVCALANKRFGCILLVEKYEGIVVRKGLPHPTNEDLFLLQLDLRKATELVLNKQMISIRVDYIPVISKFQYLMEEVGKNFCIRITIKVQHKLHFFCFQKPIKKTQKTNYYFYALSEVGKVFVYKEVEKESVYDRIYKKKQRHIITRIIDSKLELSGFFFDKIQSTHQHTSSTTKKTNKTEVGLFNLCYQALNKDSLEDCFQYEHNIYSEECLIVIMAKMEVDPVIITRQIRSIFEKSKTKYKQIFPFPKIQNKILVQRQKNNHDLSLYYVMFYHFEGKYKHFEKEYEKINQKFKDKTIKCELLPIMKVEIPITFPQLQMMKQLVLKKFKNRPKIVEKPIQNSLVSIVMKFEPGSEASQMYIYLFLSLCNLKPKVKKM